MHSWHGPFSHRAMRRHRPLLDYSKVWHFCGFSLLVSGFADFLTQPCIECFTGRKNWAVRCVLPEDSHGNLKAILFGFFLYFSPMADFILSHSSSFFLHKPSLIFGYKMCHNIWVRTHDILIAAEKNMTFYQNYVLTLYYITRDFPEVWREVLLIHTWKLIRS